MLYLMSMAEWAWAAPSSEIPWMFLLRGPLWRLRCCLRRNKSFAYSSAFAATALSPYGCTVVLLNVGALGLAFAAHRVSTDEAPGLVAAVHDAARAASQRHGCQVYLFGSGDAPRTD